MNVAKYVVAIFTIVGISGLLYTSSFLPSVFAQNTSDSDPSDLNQRGIGSFEELQNLTQGNEDLLANGSDISNTSLSSGLELESANDTEIQQLDHDPQGQTGPTLDQSAEQQQNETGQEQQQNETGQQQQEQQQNETGQQQQGQQQNETGQQQQGQQQNETGQQQNQSKGPLEQLMDLFGGGQ